MQGTCLLRSVLSFLHDGRGEEERRGETESEQAPGLQTVTARMWPRKAKLGSGRRCGYGGGSADRLAVD